MDELTHLLIQAGQGDHDALKEFISTAQPDVWRFCAAMLNPGDADDATQETFVRAWRSARSFRAESAARTWLLSIARKVCFDRIDHRLRHSVVQARLSDLPSSISTSSDHSEAIALNALIRRLPPGRRSAFVLTQVLGFSYQEAAWASGCPVGTIRSRVARARGELQTLLASPDTSSAESPSS